MLNEQKVVPKLRQEVKMKVNIVTSDDIKIYCTGKFKDFTARYIIKAFHQVLFHFSANRHHFSYILAMDLAQDFCRIKKKIPGYQFNAKVEVSFERITYFSV